MVRIAIFYDPRDEPSSTIDLSITTADSIMWFQLPTTGSSYETDITSGKRQPAGTWTVTLTPGVYGFATNGKVDISNPSTKSVSIVQAAGKDPWPPPPPPPLRAGFASQSEFEARFAKFLLALGAATPNAGTVITIVPKVFPDSPGTGISTKGAPASRPVFALLIGSTTHEGLDDVPGAATAMDDLEALLQQRFTTLTTQKLLREDATRTNVDARLTELHDWVRQLPDPSEALCVIAFSGHGVPIYAEIDNADASRGRHSHKLSTAIEHADSEVIAQAWGLYQSDLLRDDDLHRELLMLPATTEVVVISDCCFGAGLFTAGPLISHHHNTKDKNANKAAASNDTKQWSAIQRQDFDRSVELLVRSYTSRLASAFDNDPTHRNSPMICISAAGATDYVYQGQKSALIERIKTSMQAPSRPTPWRYQDLKSEIEADPSDLLKFELDARPETWLQRNALDPTVPASLPISPITDHRAIVQRFYSQVLSGPGGDDLTARIAMVLAPTWSGIGGSNDPQENIQQFAARLRTLGKLIPDLAWQIDELIEAGNRITVRGRVSGTLVGRSFDMMSIAIHTLEGGKIVRTYYLEDWSGLIRQLQRPSAAAEVWTPRAANG
jgi:Caspase domain/SnoaL-like domain